MAKQITEVIELKEVENLYDANRLLETGDWVLLKAFVDTQLCFQKATVGPNNFEKIQPFDKIVKLYILGRIR